ncbi:hypothetical protein Q7P37_008099 [Cladosporium fusiforme]
MASFLTTFALCAGVAFAAAPSCPKVHATVTSTDTWSAATTVSDYKTVTEDPVTWTRTHNSYNATITESAKGDSPDTSSIWVTDTTETELVTTTNLYTYTCSETVTTSAESTSTVYTGSYSSDLAPYCSTSTQWDETYLGGTVTETGTKTVNQPISWTDEYIPAGTRTITSYESTPTEYHTRTEWESVTGTQTISTSCTSSVYTATASAAVTQTAKCAPKNLITNVEFRDYRDNYDRMAQKDIRDGEPMKDASSCCQACQDDEQCIAMDYNEGWSCTLFLNIEENDCPLAFTIQRGEPGWGRYFVVAEGCGQIKEDGIDSPAR